ncbi:MAG: hypothetical protein ABIH46_02375 [Chloroflexota bacterium]
MPLPSEFPNNEKLYADYFRRLEERVEGPSLELFAQADRLLGQLAACLQQTDFPGGRERVISALLALSNQIDIIRVRAGHLRQVGFADLADTLTEGADYLDDVLHAAMQEISLSPQEFEDIRLQFPPPF